MSRLFRLALIALCLAGAVPAAAAGADETINMAGVTCNDIQSADEAVLMIFWLDGYLSAGARKTRVTESWFAHLAERVAKECEKNSKDTLLEVVRRMR